jgi:hypothetical protein
MAYLFQSFKKDGTPYSRWRIEYRDHLGSLSPPFGKYLGSKSVPPCPETLLLPMSPDRTELVPHRMTAREARPLPAGPAVGALGWAVDPWEWLQPSQAVAA